MHRFHFRRLVRNIGNPKFGGRLAKGGKSIGVSQLLGGALVPPPQSVHVYAFDRFDQEIRLHNISIVHVCRVLCMNYSCIIIMHCLCLKYSCPNTLLAMFCIGNTVSFYIVSIVLYMKCNCIIILYALFCISNTVWPAMLYCMHCFVYEIQLNS